MQMQDTLALDGVKILGDGYLVASVKAARTGIQIYGGAEVGRPDLRDVRIYRPEAEVFNKDAMSSFTSIPVTDDHPPEAVTADNHSKYGRGSTGEEVARDGETMRVSLIVRDAALIKKIHQGDKRELSCGYTCDLKWEPGRTDDGLEYDAIQTNIRGNHLAIVSRARGGSELKIGDSDVTLKMITVDGHQVEVTDAASIAIAGLQAKLTDTEAKLTAANTQVGTLTATVSTKDGEITALKSQAADAVMTPAKLDKLVADRALVADAAKKVFPAVVIDGKTDAEIRKQVVAHKLGDAATATMDDAGIGGAFAAFVASAPQQTTDTFAVGFQAIDTTNLGDGQKQVVDARAEMIKELLHPKAAKATA